MFSRLRASLYRTEGASAVEYAILLAAISALIVGVVFILGRRVKSVFSETNSCIASKGQDCGPGGNGGNGNGNGGNGNGNGGNGNGGNGNGGNGNGNGGNNGGGG